MVANSPQSIVDNPIEVYEVDKNRIGKALIVNIMHYPHDPKPYNVRDGSEEDVKRMRTVFQKLGFQVQVKPDNFKGSRDEVMKILEDFAKSENHVGMSMTAVCIMGHGNDGYFRTSAGASDNENIYLENVYELFNADKCESLAGKPKMFIIQTCRGAKKQGEAKNVTTDSLPENQPSTAVCAHFVIIYATIRRNVAYRHKQKGSVLIWYIHDVFSKWASKISLTDMLKLVSKSVDEWSHNNLTVLESVKGDTKDIVKQTCSIEYRGFGKELFFPK